ncbi:enoyl-CoA hydratase/isomerase family protein [Hoyosella rhizosphaerae]|uniref:Enoyl-CoA hydratase/isomerase n=1 Tax=Hoyosella rhizosphaerae TaxID=1755582 RepID=A0A916XEH3_9ACTN|nr:enoyl-CoA hydratase-related protein [Hoyosella rhizosphaerae]MBN4926051.1 enoyl-CoA hydratase/isomerase family protein [Hoyosella rhizosphaerae]GGC65927.1 putative enoyl-CoA hydratase/isomerase [Hoyosella rhizosphaerae]
MPYLTRDGDVFVLYLGNEGEQDNENRFHPDWMDAVHASLDEVEASEGPAALVVAATGKFFSNGLDVEWIFGNLDKVPEYLDRSHTIFSRLLTFPMPTVSAIQGHAFGAGAMLAISTDFQVMRSDRGFYCLPEVDLSMPFTVGMNALLNSRLPKQTAIEAMTTGRRFGGEDALKSGIVQSAVPGEDVLATAVSRVANNASKRGPNLAGIKRSIHGDLLAALAVKTRDTPFSFG